MGKTASRRHRGRARPAKAPLTYTIDGQGRVRAVQDAPPLDTALRRADAAPPVTLRTLVAPLTWEPVQRLRAWGAREGLTAAELLDTCRVGLGHMTLDAGGKGTLGIRFTEKYVARHKTKR